MSTRLSLGRRGPRRRSAAPPMSHAHMLESAAWAAADGIATAEQLALLEADPRRVALHARATCSTTPRTTSTRSGSSTAPSGPRWSPTSRPSWPGSKRPTTCSPGGRRSRRGRHRRRRPRRRGPAAGVVGGGPDRGVGGRARHRAGHGTTSCPTGSRPSAARRWAGAMHAGVAAARRRPGRGAGHPGRRSRSAGSWPSAAAWADDGVGRQRAPGSAGWRVAAVRLVARGAIVPTLPGSEAARRPHARPRRAVGRRRWSTTPSSSSSPRPCPARSPCSPAAGRRGPSPSTCSAPWSTPSSAQRRRPARAAGPAAASPHHRRGRRGLPHPARRLARSRRRSAPAPRSSKRLDRWASPVTGAGRATASSCSSTRPTRATPGSCRCSAPAPRAASCPIEAALADSRPPSRWPTSWPASSGSCPALQRPGGQRRGQVYLSQDEAWELMTVHRPAARAPPASTCGCRRCRAARPSPALRLFAEPTRRHRRRRPPAQQRALVGACSTTSSSPRPRSPAWPAEARPLVRSARQVGRARPGRPRGGRRGAGRARPTRPSSPAPRSCATRSASRARRSPAASSSTAAAGPPTCSSRRRASPTEPITTPEGFVGELRTYQAEALGLARLPRRRRARRLPRARHGPRQDADRARPPRPHRRRRARRW